VLGPIGVKRCRPSMPRVAAAVTLVELLCVICILAILASLLLPAVARAYGRARGFAEEFEAPEVASMLCHSTRNYCAANPQFQFTSKTDFADKCRPAPKCRDWIEPVHGVYSVRLPHSDQPNRSPGSSRSETPDPLFLH